MTRNAVAHICCVVLLAALVQAQSDECYNAMKCTTPEARKAILTQNKPEICRLVPGIIECGERINKLCDDPEMSKVNEKNFNGLKESLANCEGFATRQTPTTTAVIKLSLKECATKFMSCDVNAVQKATMDENNTDLVCKTFTVVSECLDNALSVCPDTGDKNVPQMATVLENMRAKFVNLKCAANPEPERSRYDSASFLATSIIQTCIALILVALLH